MFYGRKEKKAHLRYLTLEEQAAHRLANGRQALRTLNQNRVVSCYKGPQLITEPSIMRMPVDGSAATAGPETSTNKSVNANLGTNENAVEPSIASAANSSAHVTGAFEAPTTTEVSNAYNCTPKVRRPHHRRPQYSTRHQSHSEAIQSGQSSTRTQRRLQYLLQKVHERPLELLSIRQP